jgi:hypothetical protein
MFTLDQARAGWEIVKNPPYSPDLTSNDFHLFVSMYVQLGGQQFQTDDEITVSCIGYALRTKAFMENLL